MQSLNLATLDTIQAEIKEWAINNFGGNESKHPAFRRTGTRIPSDPGPSESFEYGIPIHSLAPLLGMVEECGELAEASTEAQMVDALADIGVYLCDYGNREGFLISSLEQVEAPKLPDGLTAPFSGIRRITLALGRLAHCTLKRHQGIRGFDDNAKYTDHRNKACKLLLNGILTATEDLNAHYIMSYQFINLLSTTWDKVKQRNWKKTPKVLPESQR